MNKGPEDLLLLGKILRPHGLGGLLRMGSYAESEDSFLSAGRIFLKDRFGDWRQDEVLSLHPHKGGFLLKLKGVGSAEQAEELRGASVYVEKSVLKRKDEEEFFWEEIIGLEVYLNTGRYIGEVEHILATAGNDIYIVRKGDSEILVPAVHGVVEEIDLPGRRMIISDMEGLLELNEA